MEFIEWSSVITAFYMGDTPASLRNFYFLSFAIAGGIYLICLLLGGFAMYTMAKKVEMKHSFLAFIPFANTYFAGKLAGETNFFGQKMKREGLYAMLAEILYAFMTIFYYVGQVIILPFYEQTGFSESGQALYTINAPANLYWLVDGLDIIYIIANLLSMVQLVFFFVLYTALFRKYYARGPFLMAFLSSILPFRAVTMFAVRKNTPVNYMDFLRRRAEQYARQQQAYGGYPGGYQGGNYGGGYNSPAGGSAPDDPFSEFGGGNSNGGNAGNSGNNGSSSSDDPFSEFGGGNNSN